MSEPQRRSLPGVTEGQEPGEGIADPATVAGGTLGKTAEAAADDQQADPAGHPHDPAPAVPAVPTDAATTAADDDAADVRAQREAVRDDDGQGSWGPGPE